MLIENVMYFALGALISALLALIVLPAVWRRAVRLTKRRIEAATPMTMAEFRADKDQLRAQFALSTRRLEMQVEQLRARLAQELSDAGTRQADLASIKAERETHLAVTRQLEESQAELREEVSALERENADLAQRLRMREREVAARTAEIMELRQALETNLPTGGQLQREALSGDYDEDTARLTAALAIERKRSRFLEDEAKTLVDRLEATSRRSERAAAITRMRQALDSRNGAGDPYEEELIAAEATIASAETRLNAILAETASTKGAPAGRAERALAEELSLEEQLAALRARIDAVEGAILSGWNGAGTDTEGLRSLLSEIASDVSRVVYSADSGIEAAQEEESLFERVQRFADDGVGVETLPARTARPPRTGKPAGKLSDRMTALSEILGS